MRKSLMMLMLVAQPALAEDWSKLTGDQITTALTARVLQYEDGARQQFNFDGSTLYETPAPSIGAWRVEGDQYCSQWPPSDRWSCYDVALNGLGVRFTSGDGSAATGRYVDLQ